MRTAGVTPQFVNFDQRDASTFPHTENVSDFSGQRKKMGLLGR